MNLAVIKSENVMNSAEQPTNFISLFKSIIRDVLRGNPSEEFSSRPFLQGENFSLREQFLRRSILGDVVKHTMIWRMMTRSE